MDCKNSENKKDYTRRGFLKSITTATIGSIGAGFLIPSLAKPEVLGSREDFPGLSNGATILFQGDSITDAGRNKNENRSNSGLGSGYVFLAAADLRNTMSRENLQFYNRGISGNKVYQLAERWQEDCLDLEPDVLSILIGVNDFWHTLDGGYNGTPEKYEKDFRALLQRTKKAVPDTILMIGEPFVVREGSAITDDWFPDFTDYQEAAKQIARDFEAAFIPYQSVFDEAGNIVSPTYWAADGVHPTLAGSHLMATAWQETFRRIYNER